MSDAEQKLIAATHDFYRSQLDRLEVVTRETGIPRARLVRNAIDAYLAQYESERRERRAQVLDNAA